MTEVAHYLRLLYAKVGELHCPKCDARRRAELARRALRAAHAPRDARRSRRVYAPAVRARKGHVPRPLHRRVARRREDRARRRRHRRHRPAAEAREDEGAHDRSHRLLRHARGARSRDVRPRARVGRAARFAIADGAPTREAARRPRRCSRPRARARAAARACRSSTRAGSRSTRSKGGARRARARASRAARRRSSDEETDDACDDVRRVAPRRAVPRRVRVHGETYAELTARDVDERARAARDLALRPGTRRAIAKAPHAELLRRLAFVEQVGLGYLALDRPRGDALGRRDAAPAPLARSSAAGSPARSTCSTSRPSASTRATRRRSSRTCARSPTCGSTVLVVEHDAETIRAADHVIDLGPGGGRNGGHIVVRGAARRRCSSIRARRRRARSPRRRGSTRPKRPLADAWIELAGAPRAQPEGRDFRVPVGRMCVVAGVSGSGKSTLVRHVFYPALRRALGLVAPTSRASIRVAQGAQGRASARSRSTSRPSGGRRARCPATFLGVWDEIRKLFAVAPRGEDARLHAGALLVQHAERAGGARRATGKGSSSSEMAFLPDVVAPCEACGGARFEPSTLDIRYAGLSIGDVLHLSAEDAATASSRAHRRSRARSRPSHDLGVGYVQIGPGLEHALGRRGAAAQARGGAHAPAARTSPRSTCSTSRRPACTCPTCAGSCSCSSGSSRAATRSSIIEHHPDVIASADWVVELGPEAGRHGGEIVYAGEARALSKAKTPTGRYLAGEKGRESAKWGAGAGAEARE